MTRQWFLVFLLFFLPTISPAQTNFDKIFTGETLRVDYYRTGDAAAEKFTFDRALRQGPWAGSRTRLFDDLPYGRSVVTVVDPGTDEVLFSRRFDSFFGEYRTTGPAIEGHARTIHESVLVPFPRKPVDVRIDVPGADPPVSASWTIDPAALAIASEPATAATVTEVQAPAPPARCLDIAFLGEGYTAAEGPVFAADLERFAAAMLEEEPYASMKESICIRGVLAPSQDSGTDEPRRGHWRRTALGTSFNTFASERYLLTEDNRSLRDVAANVPYDTLLIMVNAPRYGGGGIYNLYCTFTAHNSWSAYLMLHEFGHSFGGLADEYYTSSVAYEDLQPIDSEPTAPNITALLDPAQLKWLDLVDEDTPLPTPWSKEEYDLADRAYQAERQRRNESIAAAWRRGDAAAAKRLESGADQLSANHAAKMREFLANEPMAGKVGAFEGAGYRANGLYRPTLDCLMFSRARQPLCPVCRRAVEAMIRRFIDPAD